VIDACEHGNPADACPGCGTNLCLGGCGRNLGPYEECLCSGFNLWVVDGMHVLYAPVLGDSLEFAGVVDGHPWQLGGHTWVVTVKDLEPAYGQWRGDPKLTRLTAVALSNLRSVR
jgi:hypothetical protein